MKYVLSEKHKQFLTRSPHSIKNFPGTIRLGDQVSGPLATTVPYDHVAEKWSLPCPRVT